MKDPKPVRVASPTSLDDAAIAELLEAASREYSEELDEAAAFRRLSSLLARRGPSSWRRRRWPLLAVALVAVAVALVAPARRDRQLMAGPDVLAQPDGLGISSPPSAQTSDFDDTSSSEPPVIRPSEQSTPLAAGKRSRFLDGTVAAVGADAVAKVASVKKKTRVVLERGQIELSVAQQSTGGGFEVESGAYRFEVLGTVFRVEASERRISLEVSEGKVAVWQGPRLVKHVAAGQLWKSEMEAPGVAATPVERGAEAAEVDCLGLARRGQAQAAERCFLERATGSGLDAEMALYEVARLRVDVLGNADGALEPLREYAERFPAGSLRHEVDVFRVELLSRLGHAQEALDGTEALLASATGRERAAELYVLRGNVYRQSLGDPAMAEQQYARAEQSGGAAGAQATYLRGLCFEALDQPEAAIASYRRYVSVPGRPQADQARARLQKLEQRSSTIEKVRTP